MLHTLTSRLLDRYAQMHSSDSARSGFTMIELLVVIAVIGVLAVAVLSSINPIEQINKGRDTRTRSDAAQMINANDRYYAIQEFFPWNRTTASYTTADADPESEFEHSPGDDWDWLDDLVTTAEVKEGFVNRIKNDDTIYVYKEGISNATMYSCFIPRSQAFKLEAARNCQNNSEYQSIQVDGTSVCVTTDGTLDDDNMICLP